MLFSWSCFAQVIPADPKAEKHYLEGRDQQRKNNPDKALKAFTKALSIQPDHYEARARRSLILMDRKDPAAEDDLRYLVRLDPAREPGIWLALARLCRNAKRYENAIRDYTSFFQYCPPDHPLYPIAQTEHRQVVFTEQAIKNPVPFDPVPLCSAINDTTTDQYGLIYAADGSLGVFTRRVHKQEDFYIAYRLDSVNMEAEPLHTINTPNNEGMHTLSSDGHSLIYTLCHDKSGFGSCDLYRAERMPDGTWTKPVNMGKPINTSVWDAQPTLSADGNTLIFSSTRPGGLGGSDLWWTTRTSVGTWSDPVPLPGTVNTSGNEQSPYLHADGRTLYFSSDTHPGMGDFDLFVSRFDPDSGWCTIVNLGYPINTEGHEGALSLDIDGMTAYFATDRFQESKQRKHLQLYRFTLPPDKRGTQVTYVRGVIRDAVTKSGLPGVIRFRVGDGPVQEVQSRLDGYFLCCLSSGQDWALSVENPGYSFFSDRFYLTDSAAFKPYDLIVDLWPILKIRDKEGSRIVLRNVLFPSGSDRFLTESFDELQRLRDWLTENDRIRIKIEGHTDNIGTAEENLILSERRALAVKQWLIDQGIASARLETTGFGAERPVADNATNLGRKLNRRTEIVILP